MNRKEEMYAHIRDCATSGESQKSYCRARGISQANFYYWKKRYRQEYGGGDDFVTITSAAKGFHTGYDIEILFPDGSRLTCGYDIPRDLLRTLTGR
jgi:hypothetical protein